MKRTFILLLSAAALTVVLAIVTFAWQAQTQTYWDGSGWQSTYSDLVTATTSTGYVIADATGSSHNCGQRSAYAYLPNSGRVASSQCTISNPTPSCCNKVQWNPTPNTQYKAEAWQNRFTNQDCGPTIATIQSSSLYLCRSGPSSP